jgi:hypothetical protein
VSTPINGLGGQPWVQEQRGVFATPYEYTVPATLVVEPDACTAIFDGSGAGAAWLPTLSFFSPEGVLLASISAPIDPLAPGDIRAVSWFPFAAAAKAASGGIQFDTNPQAGTYLYLQTSGPGPFAYGIDIQDNSTQGILFESNNGVLFLEGATEVSLSSDTADVDIGAEINLGLKASTGDVNLTAPNGDVGISASPSTGTIRFGRAGGSDTMRVNTDTRKVWLNKGDLPTSDPGVQGQIYQVAGVLMVSL